MLCIKKIKPGKGNKKEKPKPIDIAWVTYIGMNKLGYTEKDVYLMQFGKWLDLFETYKSIYNFEISNQIYKVWDEVEKRDSVMDL